MIVHLPARRGKGPSAVSAAPSPPPVPTPDDDPNDPKRRAAVRARRHARMMADTRLSFPARVVADALKSYAYGGKVECWPSLASIGKRIGRKECAVRLALQELAHFGAVAVQADATVRTGRRYRLLWLTSDATADPAPTSPSPRLRENSRVKNAQARLKLQQTSNFGDQPGEGGVCNSRGGGGRNYRPESSESLTSQGIRSVDEEGIRDYGYVSHYQETENPTNPDADLSFLAVHPSPDDARARLAALRPLEPGATEEAEALARTEAEAVAAVLAEVLDGGSLDFVNGFKSVCLAVVDGKLAPAAALDCWTKAHERGTKFPGRRFLDTAKRYRANGGTTLPSRFPTPAAVKPVALPPAYKPSALPNLVDAFNETAAAFIARRGEGLDDDANHAATTQQAEAFADARGLAGTDRECYLEAVRDGVSHARWGVPPESPAERLRKALGRPARPTPAPEPRRRSRAATAAA